MVDEVVAPTRRVPWKGLAMATFVAAIGAFGLNLALGRALTIGIPDAAAIAATDTLVDGADPTSNDAIAAGELTEGEVGVDGLRSAPSHRLSEADYRAKILGRNLFDASKIGQKDEDCIGDDCEEDQAPGGLEIAAMLTGTVVSDIPAYSAAFIVEEGKTSAMAYGIGQELQGAQIVEILDDRVRLRRGTDERELILGQKASSGAKSTSVAVEGEPAADGGVTKNSETSFTIDKTLWESKMGDLTSLTREARALLHRGPDGNYDGYRLSAIRRGSLADQLGIKNGDIIHDINGLALDSVDNAMKAFDTMRSDSSFKIQVTRRGQPVALDYAVR